MPAKSKGPSQRQLKVGESLRHALAELLLRTDINDPELSGVSLTVAEIRPSPDLRKATVYVLPLGGRHQEEVIEALNKPHISRFLRGELARKITLKYMPELEFALDKSFDEGDHIEELLRSPKVAQDLD